MLKVGVEIARTFPSEK